MTVGRWRPESFPFTFLLSLLGALAGFATDMSLPATAATARAVHASVADVGLTLSAFMTSFAIGPLIVGPVSDRYGRRPVVAAICVLFIVASLGCCLSRSLGALVFWRFLQGFGGAARPLATAIIGDHFTGAAARAKMSNVAALGMFAPLSAPTIGSVFLLVGGWRLIYLFFAIAGLTALVCVWVGLDEPHPLERRSSLTPAAIISNYLAVLRNPTSIIHIAIAASSFGVVFGYVSGSPIVMMQVFKLTSFEYGLSFAVTATGLIIGSIVNARLNAAGVSPTRLLAGGLMLLSTGAFLFLMLSLLGIIHVGSALACLTTCTFGSAIVGSNASQLAIAPMRRIAGTASAVAASLQLCIGALSGLLVSSFFDGHSSLSMAMVMAGCGSLGMIFLGVARLVRVEIA